MSTLDRDPDDPAHAPVRAALAETGADLLPKPGWEAQVWERIDAGGTVGRGAARDRRAVWMVGGGVLAAAAIALLVWRGGGGGREPIVVAEASVSVEIRRSSTVVRSETAAPGDIVVVRQPAAGGVVWVYRGESTLVMVCDAARVAPGCRRDSAGVVAEVVMDRPGTYHVLTSVSTPSTSTAPATIDEARALLTTAAVRFRHDELDVR